MNDELRIAVSRPWSVVSCSLLASSPVGRGQTTGHGRLTTGGASFIIPHFRMMTRYENRVQLAMALVVGLLLLANLFTLTLVALVPTERGLRAPVLFSVFFVTLLVSLPAVFMLPRWLLKPYRQLVGEAERAPVATKAESGRDETEFVLETFQAVVEQLR